MLSNQHFYYRTIRKNVIAFGTLFKHIQMASYAKDTYDEIDRITVPLTYATKEDFVKRLYANPDLHKQIQILLPKMSFEMTGIAYDPSRKLSSYNVVQTPIAGNNSSATKQYAGIPYNMEFEINIYVRNVEDGTQIVEQILPYFNPDYTLSMAFIDGASSTRDVPIILENISYVTSGDGDAETMVRTLVWTLTFKMKTYFFGPTSTAKIIREATGNILNDPSGHGTGLSIFVSPGSSTYKIGESVYQGPSLNMAKASGLVLAWDSLNSILKVAMDKGSFSNTSNIIGAATGTSRNILDIEPKTGIMERIVITPNPPTANIGDDFGFTEVIYEFPNI